LLSELSPEIITIIWAVAVLAGVFTGYPVALVLGGVGLIGGYFILGPTTVEILYSRVFSLIQNYPLICVPLFILMGILLERSGLTDDLFEALYIWFGGFRGGLAIGTILIGTLLAACLGIIAASITILALTSLLPMLKRGYDRSFASGAIAAGGTLGILIPPSVMLVLYGPAAELSVGKLFMAAFLPGLLLATLYCTYIAVRALLSPGVAPSISAEQTKDINLRYKILILFKSLVPPLVLMISVLGTIFLGIAPPTEAAAIGASAAVLMTIIYRKFSWQMFKEALLQTVKLCAFIMVIACCSYAFVGVVIRSGSARVIEDLILAMPFGRWGAFGAVMFAVFILGMLIDWIAIIFIVVPIVSPLLPVLGFDPLWFALMVCINLQMGFMTPPFAQAIFILKGTAPPEAGLTMSEIIRGVYPFVGLVAVGLVLCAIFPEIILWLPSRMIR